MAAALTLLASGVLAVAITSPATAATTISGADQGGMWAVAAGSPITVAAGARASVMAKDGLHVYVLSMSGDAISSIDTSTNLVVGTLALTVGENPVAMIQSPDGSKLYLVDAFALAKVSTVDVASFTETASNSVAAGTFDAIISPDGATLYAVKSGSVTAYSLPSFTAGVPVVVATGPLALNITPDGTKIYVAIYNTGNTVVLDVATNAIVGLPIATGVGSQRVKVSPDGQKVYVTSDVGNSLTAITVSSGAATTQTVAGALAIAFSPDSRFAYVGEYANGKVDTIDVASNSVVSTVSSGLEGLDASISPDGTQLYLPRDSSTTVSALHLVRLAFSGQKQITPGTATATFAVSLKDGNPTNGDYSGDPVTIDVIDSTSAVVATGTIAVDPVTGNGTVTVPTAALPIGGYTLRATVAGQSSFKATAATFDIVQTLAATGIDPSGFVLAALLLLGGGLWMRHVSARARAAL
jgi:DNA-binding beta-propeller fold protein YncE